MRSSSSFQSQLCHDTIVARQQIEVRRVWLSATTLLLALLVWLPATSLADDPVSVTASVSTSNASANQPVIIPDSEPLVITGDDTFDSTFEGQPTELLVDVETPENGYWFLNTHSCPQTFRKSGPVFRPGVSRYRVNRGYRRTTYAELLGSIEPGVPVCIMVHGSFMDTHSASQQSCHTYHWLRSAAHGDRVQMIYFHWPSYRALSPLIQLDTNQLGKQAARNGFYLAQLVSDLPAECPVAILGHSHGSRVTSSALHLMAGGIVQGYQHTQAGNFHRPIRTVFFAGAIDHNWLNPGERYGRALCSTQGILNMTNCGDPALAIYPLRLPFVTRRPIGNIGMTDRDRLRIGQASGKVLNFEANAAVGRTHHWPAYYNSPRIAQTIRNYVYFPDLMNADWVTAEAE